MDTIVIKAKSKKNLDRIIELAKQLGVEVSILSEKASEDLAIAMAIKEGKSDKLSNKKEFIKGLKSDFAD